MNKTLLIVGSCIPAGLFASVTTGESAKPNIVCILVDDLGYGDLSCQGFAEDIRTPNIDKLLNNGCRFTNFYANSNVSSPSRAALLTGCYPDKVGVPGVIRTQEDDSWGYLSPNAIILPQILKKSGYRSAIVGKWHLGLQFPNTPNGRGFDYFHGFLGDMMDDYYTHLRLGNNYMRENLKEINPQGHATELFTNWAIDYFNKQKGSSTPFFMYLAYNAPHDPIQPPVEYLEKVKKRDPSIPEKRAALVALIEHLDDNIGRVIKALEDNKQLENTLIIFVSDNGGDQNANNGPLRGKKGDMFEGGIRVPAGFFWKGKINPSVSRNFAMLSDIFPTLCELTGTTVNHQIDGISILPTLRGEQQVTDERQVYWVRREGGYNSFRGKECYASRYKAYKILQNTPFEPLLFFNLNDDSMEQSPLKPNDSPEYRKLSEGLMKHIQEAGSVPWQK